MSTSLITISVTGLCITIGIRKWIPWDRITITDQANINKCHSTLVIFHSFLGFMVTWITHLTNTTGIIKRMMTGTQIEKARLLVIKTVALSVPTCNILNTWLWGPITSQGVAIEKSSNTSLAQLLQEKTIVPMKKSQLWKCALIMSLRVCVRRESGPWERKQLITKHTNEQWQ